MLISMIAALSENEVIGYKNKLPWHIPEELKHFKAITLNKPIIMGRKTFESMGSKPLPQRKNIIITKDSQFVAKDCVVVHSLKEALAAAEPAEEVMVIGGSQIFEQFLPLASRLYLSIVHQTIEGDSFFPKVDFTEWKLTEENRREQFTIRILDRKISQEAI